MSDKKRITKKKGSARRTSRRDRRKEREEESFVENNVVYSTPATHHSSVLAFLVAPLEDLEPGDPREGQEYFWVSRIKSSRFSGTRANNHKFPGRTNRNRPDETPVDTAVRAFEEEFGMKVESKDLKLAHIEIVNSERRTPLGGVEPFTHVRYYYVVLLWADDQVPRVGEKHGNHEGTWFLSHPEGDPGLNPKFANELLSADWELFSTFWEKLFDNYREAFEKIVRHYALRVNRFILPHMIEINMYAPGTTLEELDKEEKKAERALDLQIQELPAGVYNPVMEAIEAEEERAAKAA